MNNNTEGNKLIAEFMGWKKMWFLFRQGQSHHAHMVHDEPFDAPRESEVYFSSGKVKTRNTFWQEYKWQRGGNDTLGTSEKYLEYSTSWSWLMPVVEKIGTLRVKSSAPYNSDLMFKVEICNGYTKIEGTPYRIFHNASVEGSMLVATYNAILDFIKWYNEQNKG